MVPITVPGGKPVTAVPAETPRSPFTIVAPVLVTVDPAKTAKAAALPRATGSSPALPIWDWPVRPTRRKRASKFARRQCRSDGETVGGMFVIILLKVLIARVAKGR